MLTLVTLLFGIVLQIALVFRGIRSGNIRRYPFFYAYIASGLFQSFIVYFFRFEYPAMYDSVFWPTQFISLFIGCGVVLDIFGSVLTAYPGAARFAKATCILLFLVLFFGAGLYLKFFPGATVAGSEVQLERNLRTIQSLALIGVLFAILYYGIRLGKNLFGMIAGYGIYLGASVVVLAARFARGGNSGFWLTARPFAFEVSLAIWVAYLWNYYPDPVPGLAGYVAPDYETLVASTRRALGTVRSYLGRSTRS